ncbi:BatD family protein [Marinobacter sp. P4B1]|uniref:BatD family protein n=1 Tax=Marinobacter sp. P4B1 TaxID=1119533 RepID=UPI00071CAC01|nr:BatD family protein [Marinobacter sp. P4B1]KRW83251.1 hypothetical protein AQ621_07475 [Marinobacter sp. P4B1]
MVKRILLPVFLLLIQLAALHPAQASELSVEPDRTQLYEGEVLTLTVRGSMEIDLNLSNLFNFDLSDLPSPDIEKVEPDFEILARNQRYSVQTVNGDMTGEITWTYQLAPTRTGKLTIPELTFKDATSEPVEIDVVTGTAPDQEAGARDSFIELSADKAEVYVQEQLVLTIQLFFSGNLIRGELSEPEHPDAIIESLGKQREFTRYRDGVRYRVVERRYAIFPQQPGPLSLAPIRFEGQTRDANGQLKFLRDQQQLYEVPVKPVPDAYPADQPWLPARSLALAEDGLPPAGELNAGANLTRKITLHADGLPAEALPPLPQETPAAIRSYPESPLRNTETTVDGLRSTLQQEAALVPVQAGDVVLPAIRIPWWNTETDQLEQAILPERRYTITGNSAVAAAPVPDNSAPETPPATTPVTADDQPPADNPGSFWLWLSLVLGLLWLATLVLWWLSRKPSGGALSSEPLEDDTEKHAYEQLIRSVKNGSADTTGQLLHWARLRFPEQRFATVSDVVRFSDDPELAGHLKQLQAQLFSQHQQAVSNEARQGLGKALERLRKRKAQSEDSRYGLPPLHSISR